MDWVLMKLCKAKKCCITFITKSPCAMSAVNWQINTLLTK